MNACVDRSTQRKAPKGRHDEDALTRDIIRLAEQHGRYGYHRITALLNTSGWSVNVKRVHRIWRREGLKVPMKQPKRGRLWLSVVVESGCGGILSGVGRAHCRVAQEEGLVRGDVLVVLRPKAIVLVLEIGVGSEEGLHGRV